MTIDYEYWNTRERALSSDLNAATDLFHRVVQEAMAFITSGTTRKSGVFGDSFICTPSAGTMNTTITPGLALYVDTGAVYPVSQTVWIESTETRQVTHAAADALPRYDVIEMQPGSVVSSTEPRDVFDPITGTFTVTNLTKQVRSYPTFQVRTGTPSANPSIPAGTAGWIPLAYVYVPGGAVSLTATDVVYCRPILAALDAKEAWASPAPTSYATEIQGGGINAAGASLAVTVNRTLEGRFVGHNFKFRATATCPATVTTLNSDGGFPAADGIRYWYAIPAPYPSGYDTSMAPREFWTPTPSLVYSGGYEDATYQQGCLIINSAVPPNPLLGPAGPSAATASFNHTFFSAAASSSDRTGWVYVGSSYYELAGNEIVAQRTRNNLVATQRKPGADVLALFPIGVNTFVTLNSEVAGDPVIQWPMLVAREVTVEFRCALNPASWARVMAFDELSDDAANAGMVQFVLTNTGAAQYNASYLADMYLDSAGRIVIEAASQSGAASFVIFLRCYKDAVLQQR